MRKGYGSHFLCVYVTTLAATYLVYTLKKKVLLSFLWCFLHMHCVDFVKNALFKSYGDICRSFLPSLLLDRLSMDKTDSDGIF